MTILLRARLLGVAGVLAALLVVVLSWSRAADDPRALVEDDSSSRQGWRSIEHDGVRVDVPAAWQRVDTSECEFRSEHWAPPDVPRCAVEQGIAFYASATFDPAHGPGVRRATEVGTPAWSGYAYAGDLAVYVSYAERSVVERVLASARQAA